MCVATKLEFCGFKAYVAAEAGCGDVVWICDDVNVVIDKSSSMRKKATKKWIYESKSYNKATSKQKSACVVQFFNIFRLFFIASSSHQWSDDRNWRRCAKNTPVTTGILKRVTCEREESENCTLSHSISAHLCVFLLIEWWMIWFISIVRWNKWKNAFGILTFATNTVVVSPITLQSFRWCCQSLILGAGMRKSGVRTEVIRRE